MRNEDIIKHLMNIKDGCLSSCEKAAVTGAIDIVSDYDKQRHSREDLLQTMRLVSSL